MMLYTITLTNSSGGELDRKTGDDIALILAEYIQEGCLSGADTLRIIDHGDED